VLTPASRATDFPTLAQMTYLNSAAEGIAPAVLGTALAEYFRDKQFGSAGRPAHLAQWEAARALAAEFLGLSAEEVGICSCSSEAYNLAALALNLQPGEEVVVNDLDFPAGRTPWCLPGCPATVRWWRAREGALRLEDLTPLLGPRTRLVSTSLVSYHNGFTLSVPALAEAVRAASPALLAVDVTQALGRIPLDLRGADLLVSSTHKWICGPHGGGIVGVPAARAAEWTVPAGGWFNLVEPFAPDAFERVEPKPGAAGFMVGMPNFPALYGIRAALEYIQAQRVEEIEAAAQPLVQQCLEGLRDLPVEIITPREEEHLAGILAFRHPDMERLQAAFEAQRIHVMHSAGRLRVSLHAYNTPGDVEHFLTVLRTTLAG